MGHDSSEKDAFDRAMLELFEVRRRQREEWIRKHPPDPPNEQASFAFIEGFQLDNSVGFRTGDLVRLMELEYETLFIWTQQTDVASVLVSQVAEKAQTADPWITVADCISLAGVYHSAFEHDHASFYHWMYDFDPTRSLRAQDFGEADPWPISARHLRLSDIANMAPAIQLLLTDQSFQVAAQNIRESFRLHWFCLSCALREPEHRDHDAPEPQRWEYVQLLPKTESAIVLATRAVEALVGKPPNREKRNQISKLSARWQRILGVDPQDEYLNTGKSYLELLYDLFEVRGRAAHSLGTVPFEVRRSVAIEAQTYAAILLRTYFLHNSVSDTDASESLGLNIKLVSCEPQGWSTTMTADSSSFRMVPDDSWRDAT